MREEPFITAVKRIFEEEELPLYSYRWNREGHRVIMSSADIQRRFGPMSWVELAVLKGLIKRRLTILYGTRGSDGSF